MTEGEKTTPQSRCSRDSSPDKGSLCGACDICKGERYMKATGIVRRVDDLGRIVIPKEIRRTLKIREGDPLEIYTEKDGGVIFRKYSPMGDLLEVSTQLCQSMGEQAGVAVAVSDRDTIIALSGAPKKELLEKACSSALSKLLDQRKVYCYEQGQALVPASEENGKYHLAVVAPILCQGDILGGVLMLAEEPAVPTETQRKLAQTAAAFLGKQMES